MKWTLRRWSERRKFGPFLVLEMGPYAHALRLVRQIQAEAGVHIGELWMAPDAAAAVLFDRGLLQQDLNLECPMTLVHLRQTVADAARDVTKLRALAVCLAVDLDLPMFCVAVVGPTTIDDLYRPETGEEWKDE